MKYDRYENIFLSPSDPRGRKKYRNSKQVSEGKPEMIQRKKHGDDKRSEITIPT